MAVLLFVLERAVGHGSPLCHVFLYQYFMLECRCAIDDGYEEENEQGDAMG